MLPILLLLMAPAAEASPVPAGAGCSGLPIQGGFEAGTASDWTESSSNGLKVLCTPGTCGTGNGTAGPNNGIWWAWMGGISDVQEVASVSRSVTIPIGSAELRFFLWIGASSGNGQDFITASLDGVDYISVFEGDPGHTGGYAEVFVDVSDKADGASHSLKIEAVTEGDGVTNFSVDDVSMVSCQPPPPVISIGNAAPVAEGNTGSISATFTVSLSNPAAQTVSVAYSTGPAASGVPATPGADYLAQSGTLSFVAGTTTLPVSVSVLGDTLDEPAETFAVTLAAPVGGSLGDAVGDGTITDDDLTPALSVADLAATEGDAGAAFTVSLSAPSGLDVSVSYATADGTATAGADYTAAAGTLTLPAGTASTTVPVPIAGDAIDEMDESFTLTLSGPVNATLADAQGQAVIDDDDGPSVSIDDVEVAEGNAGTVDAVFTVTLSAPSPQAVSVSFQASDGTAVGGLDYVPASGTLTFAPGLTLRTQAVGVLGDVLDEPDETFHVSLTGTVDAGVGDPVGLGRILDDDGAAIALEGELVHGSLRWEDLQALPGPAPDQDIYLLERPPRSSFEVVVDAASPDVGSGSGPFLERLAPDMVTVVQASVPIGSGSARSLRMENAQGFPVTDYVRVRSAGCGTDCDASDVYRIRAWETTASVARFNNGASQVSLVVLANVTPATVAGTLWFRDAAGTLLGSSAFSLATRAALVLDTSAVPGVSGQGGTLTVSHNGPYGALVGKAVAVEAAAGFAFDTPLVHRPR